MKLTSTEIDKDAQLKTLGTLARFLWAGQGRATQNRILLAFACLLVGKFANVWAPVFYKRAIDQLALPAGAATWGGFAVALIFAYGAARVGAQFFGELRDALFAKVEHRVIRQVALDTFRHLHNLSLRFHLDRKTGGLSRAIERGTNAIETVLRFMVFNILPTFFEILVVAGVLWVLYGPAFSVITLGTLTLYVIFTILMTEWRTHYVRTMNSVDSEANTKAIDSLLNYETVKYFSNEGHESARYDQALEKYEHAAIKSKVLMSYLNMGQGAIIALGLVGVLWLAVVRIQAGRMGIGDFVLVNTYLIQLYLPLNILGFAYREIKMSLINMEQMFTLMVEPEEVKDIENAPVLKVAGGELTFENVSFRYEPERVILDNISFHVPAGKTVAIVGPSGAGKSTISRLLFRFYDVTSGRILIDGQDTRLVSQESLRRAIGIVPQDSVLFNDTIGYNIAYGRVSATPEEVAEAARMAQIHDFITRSEKGYETLVGERGLKLSGGEKQRVAIARMLLKAPPIFLFDEATSALDTHTEKAIQASLYRVSKGHTTLIIAHRLSTVIDADEILVLERGRIVERGTHEVLLAQNGVYASMWARQMSAEAEGEEEA